MDFNCKGKAGCLKKISAFCCIQKRDLLKNNNFEKTIEIYPRVVVFKNLKTFETYHQTVTVRNTGTLYRKIKFITEPNSDVTFKINGNINLTSGAFVSVEIIVKPKKKNEINRKRYIFIIAEHPDIVWEIPIIVLQKQIEIHLPGFICLPKAPANTTSNYQFVLYNSQEHDLAFTMCSEHEALNISPISDIIPAKDFSKILIIGKVPDQMMTTSLVLSLKNGKSFKISVQLEPSNQLIHLSTNELVFDDTYIGLKSQKNIFICNRSNESISFQWTKNQTVEDVKKDDKSDEMLVLSDFVTIKNKRGCIPAMNSVLSIFNFTPPRNFKYNEEDDSQFQINTVVYLLCPILGPMFYRVHISAKILGPNIEITPRNIDLCNIYIGQIHCIDFEVSNKGPIPGELKFKDHTDQDEIHCSVTPSSIYLKTDSMALFQLSFYRREIGKFLTKLTFKIKSGNFLSILLRGNSLPMKVKVLPEFIDLGEIPICIPQETSLSIFNPFSVPIVVEPAIVDDGSENPLILRVDGLNLPLHTRTALFYNNNRSSNEHIGKMELKPSYSDFGSDAQSSSANSMNSEISLFFQNKVLGDIPSMANKLLQSLKTNFSKDQNESESSIKIIDAALDCIVDRCEYFQELREYQNYLLMDWKALPCDAREIAFEEERFYLEPNKSKTFPIVIIPNSVGPSTKTLQLKAYPMGKENSYITERIDSRYIVNSLLLQYKCTVPIIEYNDDISFSQPLYVDMINIFHMKFKNIDIVPGFVYFKVIPTTEHGKIEVSKTQQKFLIVQGEQIDVTCSVTFRKIGHIVLHGIFQLIGKILECSFKVQAEVIPPEVQISTNKIFSKQEVLQLTRTKIFIENICPTVAQFSLSLKHEGHQFVEPLGGSLAPNQKILISIYSKFLDPGTYSNCLNINLKHAAKISIPITFAVNGAPLSFEPDIKFGLDFGNLFKSNGTQEHVIKVTNFGEKLYKLHFQKQNTKKLSMIPVSIFNIEPNNKNLAPKSQEIFRIQLDTSKEITSEEEFSVDAMGEGNCRLRLFTFTVQCSVIKSKVVWNKNEISFETKNPNETYDSIFDIVSLINTTPLVANVILIVEGCFVLAEYSEGLKTKSLEFSMKGKTIKQIYVSVNESEIVAPDSMCQCFKGSINCKVNNKTQTSLPLHIKIINPSLRICTPKATFFTPHADSFSHINIHNCGLISAIFKWNEVESTIINETIEEVNIKQPFSKTISEVILTLAADTVPKLPKSIKVQFSDELSTDEEASDAELSDEETSNETKISISKIVESQHKASIDIPKSDPSITSSISLLSVSSRNTFIEQMTCKQLLTTKEETQTFHINHIFNYLKLLGQESLNRSKISNKNNDSNRGDMNQNNKSMEKFQEVKQIIRFQRKYGLILPKSMFKAYVDLPILPEGKTLVSKFNLEVIGGQTQILDLTVTSQKGRIHISRTDIDLGKHTWYEMIAEKIKITSLSPYAIKINLLHANKDETRRLSDSRVEIISPKQFMLMPNTSMDIEWNVASGLRHNFSEYIGLEINNNYTPISIRFHGSGLMPTILPLNLTKIPQTHKETIECYLHLQNLYNEAQRKYCPLNESINYSENKQSIINTAALKDDTDVEGYENRRKTTPKLNSFVFLNRSENKYPRVEDIERVIEIEKYLLKLKESEELRTAFQTFYSKFVHRASEINHMINLKAFICRPIPWVLSAFIMDLSVIKCNETNNYQIEILFVGPGKLFLSTRTQIAIPKLSASFETLQENGLSKPFAFFQQTTNQKALKKYKNKRERSLNDENVQVQDLDLGIADLHQRKRNLHGIKHIKGRNTKMYEPSKEKKNPLILSEICQTTDKDLSGSTIKLNLILAPTSEFYEIDQIIEDYVFIDVHLGPTLPILLKGIIVAAETSVHFK